MNRQGTIDTPFNHRQISLAELTNSIDHTLLKTQASEDDILRLCEQAKQYQFVTLCINPCYTALAHKALTDSPVRVASVVGFPLGANHFAVKAVEAQQALKDGAREIDMVMHIGALKSRLYETVEEDIRTIARTCEHQGALLKVIIETCVLTEDEKRIACELCVAGGAKMVKTSTGFGPSGATTRDVRLLHDLVAPFGLGVKASGGIKTLDDARAMLHAGAVRLGTSSGVDIIREFRDS
jgi:deoxyribose-phosphate aldolase